MTDWQPIETAPRDGTKIIAWRPAVGVADTMYYAEYEGLTGGAWHWADDGDAPHVERQPTHWMPLPPPPKEYNNA